MSIKCSICTVIINCEEEIKYVQAHGVKVCDCCAKIVSEAYEEWHGGGFLFGANESKIHPPVSSKVRWDVFKRDSYRCVKCGSDSDLTIDHEKPKSKGGGNEIDNLQTMCRSCNSSKGARI